MMLRQAQHRFLLIGTLLFISSFLYSGNGNRIRFIENKGQIKDTDGKTRNDILFYADVKTGRIYFFQTSLSFVTISSNGDREKAIIDYFRYDAELEGINSNSSVKGSGLLTSYSNFYLPQCPEGSLHVNEYEALVYENYFQGIDLVFSDNGNFNIDQVWIEKNKSGVSSIRSAAVTEQFACMPFSTYFGGTGNDEAWGITLDGPQENSYTNGYTMSTDFPSTVGSFQNTSNGNYDSFVIKMDSCGSRVWTTYIGSSANDFGEKIAMCGNTIVASGYTSGTDFPISNASQAINNGSYDGYLFKLNSAGARVWATYFGGSGGELGLALAVDMNKNIFLGGSTSSTDMPVLNAFQNSNNGPLDAFIAKFDSNGVRRWSTYFGGGSSEDAHSITTDVSGNVIVVGGTFSTNLSTSVGAFQAGNNGGQDAYILKFDSVGARIFSTYCGGFGNEDGYGVCTDALGNIYVSGYTNSTDFPVTIGAYQFTANTGDEIYVEKFSPSGAQQWCTYFGGSGNEGVYAMAADQNGHLFITGSTTSTNFPIIGTAIQSNNGGGIDNFILKFSTAGLPQWSTYYGGSLDDVGYDIATTANMHLALTGFTNSLNFPVTTGAFQANSNGPQDVFISRLNGTEEFIVGNASTSLSMTLSVFPNPANDQLIIELNLFSDTDIDICVSDITGKEINCINKGMLKFGIQQLIYDTRALAEGAYLMTIKTNELILTKRVIICR